MGVSRPAAAVTQKPALTISKMTQLPAGAALLRDTYERAGTKNPSEILPTLRQHVAQAFADWADCDPVDAEVAGTIAGTYMAAESLAEADQQALTVLNALPEKWRGSAVEYVQRVRTQAIEDNDLTAYRAATTSWLIANRAMQKKRR